MSTATPGVKPEEPLAQIAALFSENRALIDRLEAARQRHKIMRARLAQVEAELQARSSAVSWLA